MRRLLLSLVVVLAAILFLPSDVRAQAAIAGVVKDSTGATLPGVTVEASSPALIERVRSVVTDGAGQYRIIDLSPGTYSVTFTIAGFKPMRRTGIVLEGNFTAPVNIELEVGNLNETITVTGETPVVDVVSNRATVVVNRDMLDAIPTASRSLQARANLIPGTTVTAVGSGQTSMTIYGSQAADQVVMVDGMRLNLLEGQGQFSGIYLNDGMAQEISYDTGAQSAEVAQGGLRVNMIPREGGNQFKGIFFIQGANGPLASDNRSDAVKAFIPEPLGLAYTYEINPSFGGPIKRDKLWFYFTYKYEDFKNYVPSSSFADGSRAFRESQGNYSAVTRLTWQATQRDKIRFYLDRQFNGENYNGFNTLPTTTPEASTDAYGLGWVPQVKWTQTTTNKLLLEAGLSYYTQDYEQSCRDTVGPRDLPRLEQSTNRLSVACGNTIPPYFSYTKSYSGGASASYVTGSHAFKTGVTWQWGTNARTHSSNAEINTLVFNSALLGAPVSATNPVPCFSLPCPIAVAVTNGPTTLTQKVNRDIGLFVQDTWTIDRLTLNLGGRFDHFNASVPAQSAPAGNWIQARNFAEIPNVPNWNDFSVRLAGAYDLFGNGKTAIKANASQYIAAAAAGFAQSFNPMGYSTQTRFWADLDGNRSILDAAGNIQFAEVIGGTSNFGQITSRPDPELQRGYNWEYSTSVQHQLMERVSVTAGYYRRNFYNLDVTDNLNLHVTDWTTFGITAPGDPRLPAAGQPITMYTLNTAKIGTPTDNLRTYSADNSTVYNGIELSANLRRDKLLMFGGVTTDRRASITCDERDNPNSARFCDATPPFRTTYKLSAAYQLPWEFQLSGSFIATPGPSVSANYAVTAAVAGRPIIGSTAGGTTITVNLIEPHTVFLDYKKQLDARIGRNFRFGTRRVQAFADIFNVLNSGTVLRVSETFGANPATNQWMTPLAIMDGRYVRFGVQMSF